MLRKRVNTTRTLYNRVETRSSRFLVRSFHFVLSSCQWIRFGSGCDQSGTHTYARARRQIVVHEWGRRESMRRVKWAGERGDKILLSIVEKFRGHEESKNGKRTRDCRVKLVRCDKPSSSLAPNTIVGVTHTHARASDHAKSLNGKYLSMQKSFLSPQHALTPSAMLFVCPFDVQIVRFEGCLRCLRLWRLLQLCSHRRPKFHHRPILSSQLSPATLLSVALDPIQLINNDFLLPICWRVYRSMAFRRQKEREALNAKAFVLELSRAPLCSLSKADAKEWTTLSPAPRTLWTRINIYFWHRFKVW